MSAGATGPEGADRCAICGAVRVATELVEHPQRGRMYVCPPHARAIRHLPDRRWRRRGDSR